MSDDLIAYVFGHFAALMTEIERAAWLHLQTTAKSSGGRSDAAAQKQLAEDGGRRRRLLSSDPVVLDLAAQGVAPFQARVAERILREHRDQVFLNYCPRCGELTRTPQAKLCLHCGHSWHHASAV